jgi:hypothetical protein
MDTSTEPAPELLAKAIARSPSDYGVPGAIAGGLAGVFCFVVRLSG